MQVESEKIGAKNPQKANHLKNHLFFSFHLSQKNQPRIPFKKSKNIQFYDQVHKKIHKTSINDDKPFTELI